MKHFNKTTPVSAQAIVWQRTAEGTWDKFLVREQGKRGTVISKLTVVPEDTPVCLVCLSQELVQHPSDQYELGQWQCLSCGAMYGMVL